MCKIHGLKVRDTTSGHLMPILSRSVLFVVYKSWYCLAEVNQCYHTKLNWRGACRGAGDCLFVWPPKSGHRPPNSIFLTNLTFCSPRRSLNCPRGRRGASFRPKFPWFCSQTLGPLFPLFPLRCSPSFLPPSSPPSGPVRVSEKLNV